MRLLKLAFASTACFSLAFVFGSPAQDSPLDSAKQTFERGEYRKVITILEPVAAKDPNNAEIQLLLTKAYIETDQQDAAIRSAEKAVAVNPDNSEYHNWLGQAYGEKASHAGMLSAYSWARKTQKEFEIAVKLDEHNLSATQNLIEYDCTAPSIVGGGDDKAQVLIQKVLSMDAAQGHYAEGVCRKQKKDLTGVDTAFSKALTSNPKSMDQIREMGDYFATRGQGDNVLVAANALFAVSPTDPRLAYFRAVAWILKNQNFAEAEKNLRDYLRLSSPRSDYPSPAYAHYWLGRLYEAQKNPTGARAEYETSLKLNPKHKNAQEALKKLGGS